MRPLRVAFFGSPDFALPSLEALMARHEVVMVVAQPDKRAGRGMRVTAPPVARLARESGLELWQPTRLRKDEAFLSRLAAVGADVGVTAAYGRILPPPVLSAPRHGVLNVHASLLPRYRGAAPIQWALIRGEDETGVTIMQTEEGLDTGPIRLQRRTAIEDGEDATALSSRLARLGAEALVESLDLLAEGTLPLTPQDDSQATHAPLLTPADGHVRWHESAREIHDRFRGVSAWPGTSFQLGDERVKVTAMTPGEGEGTGDTLPGTVVEIGAGGVIVGTGSGTVALKRVKPPGGREMPARDWANGRGVTQGTRLG
ncbi:MAG TPA: methionyl-tRNA formyltransferase [Trueperaceae bacterium]